MDLNMDMDMDISDLGLDLPDRHGCVVCGKRANYGIKGEYGTHCIKHKTPGMWNFDIKRCVVCKESGAYYGIEGGKATHCGKCKDKDGTMIDLIHKLCTNTNCDVRALYGTDKGKPTHCGVHKGGAMFNVCVKFCVKCDKKEARYGLETNKRTHCDDCYKDDEELAKRVNVGVPLERSLGHCNPALASQLADKSLDPFQIYAKSRDEYVWLCPDNPTCKTCDTKHTWKASAHNRSSGSGCPWCSGYMACPCRSVAANPTLMAEWHPSKNGAIQPETVAAYSGTKVWWLCTLKPGCADGCPQVHEWDTKPSARSNGSGCPWCVGSGNVLCPCRSVAANPTLMAEWHPSKNGSIQPETVAAYSNTNVWWLCTLKSDCPQVHEWEASPNSRSSGSGCSWCSGHLVCPCRSVAANPTLLAEWHPSKNDSLQPETVAAYSGAKVWWLCTLKPGCADGCPQVHEWEASPAYRSNFSKCKWCSGHLICPCRSVAANPTLKAEWHPSKNGSLQPETVAPKSGKRVWWLCKKRHVWNTTVASRSKGSGCPRCRENKAEKLLARLLSASPEVQSFTKPRIKCFDIFTQKYRLLEPDAIVTLISGKIAMIELDGKQHFQVVYWYGPPSDLKDQISRDLSKNRHARDNGMSLLRIAYTEYNRDSIVEWVNKFIAAVQASDDPVLMVSNPRLYNAQKETGKRLGLV
jgi:hypothetical protein